MRLLIVFLLFLLGLWPALASAEYPMNVPCNSTVSGQTLIVARPPTAAELAAEPAPTPPTAPTAVLQMMNDYVKCDGTNWNLNQTIKKYKGAPLPSFVPNS